MPNADYANNITRLETTLYQRTQYSHTNNDFWLTTEIQHMLNVMDKDDTSTLIIGTNETNSSHSENI